MNVYEEIRERTEVAELSSAAERGWTHSETLIKDVRYLLDENARLHTELEAARKIRFPRQPDGEGGWTIDYNFLDQLDTKIYKDSDYSMDLEDLEKTLLAIEKFLGHEGTVNS
ncbi:hypothetical protein KQI74_28105 [Paenibacillus barcinonensis]|uniref:hypothetical protein n=1 Tax=Paenibacillus barcinonensis TaxID=198119 RepID=UPI001C126667|nr:hypothetical protein [Paenibacillus barcinonensis]MBU5356120.1 hypothetical protein [Paenibacillus barcinonensis]